MAGSLVVVWAGVQAGAQEPLGEQQRESVPFSKALQGARGGRQKVEPGWEDGADWGNCQLSLVQHFKGN